MNKQESIGLLYSTLYDEKTFYQQFISDLKKCKDEVIIECPFISGSRMQMFYPMFEQLINKGVKVYVMTRDPRDHVQPYKDQSEFAIQWFENAGIQALLCKGNHHRKLAFLDRKILYEGSLNILSQNRSREIMRRIPEEQVVIQTFNFLGFEKFF
jgi:HKD family nuclease